MSENEPASPPPADEPPSTDLQLTPESLDGAAALPPDLGLPARSLVQEPRWPHPNFWWAGLWCLLFVFVTQMPGGILGAAVLLGLTLTRPDLLPSKMLGDQTALLQSDVVAAIMAGIVFITELLVVLFSWLVLRFIVGREWPRRVALRPPSVAHTLFALASFPPLILLGNVPYELLRSGHWAPSVSDTGLLDVFVFWAAVFAVLGAAMLASLPIAGRGWTRRLALRPTRPSDVVIAATVILALLPLMLLLYQGLRSALPGSILSYPKIGGMEEVLKVSKKWPWAFAVFVIGVGPGVGEELWCRAFLGRGLVANYGAVLGVLATSFFFGLIHMDPCQGIMAMLMGLWLHILYLTTRSLWLPMLLHFSNNALGVVGPHFRQLDFLDVKAAEISPLVYVSAALLLAAVIHALCGSRTRVEAAFAEQPLFWRPTWQGVEYPPPGSGARVVHPPPSFLASSLVAVSFLLFVAACTWWIQGRLALDS